MPEGTVAAFDTLADEMRRLGLQNVRAENGKVRFDGETLDMARANIGLRCAERVLLELGSFDAPTFDALFEGVRALPLEDWAFVQRSESAPPL